VGSVDIPFHVDPWAVGIGDEYLIVFRNHLGQQIGFLDETQARGVVRIDDYDIRLRLVVAAAKLKARLLIGVGSRRRSASQAIDLPSDGGSILNAYLQCCFMLLLLGCGPQGILPLLLRFPHQGQRRTVCGAPVARARPDEEAQFHIAE